MLCSIIIRSYNEEKHIGRLLSGIKCQKTDFPVEVILVDSGSTDATVSIARQFNVQVVHLKPEEFSFGRALNLGCSHAKGNYLVFASAHVYPVCTDWLTKLLAPFAHKKVALVYGRQIGNEITKYTEHRIFQKWFPAESNYDQPTPFCNNANAAILKELWLQYPYDESLTGLEDLAWASRIIKKGFKIAYEAEATIVHVHEETPKRIYNRYKREAIAMKRIISKIHFSFFDFLRLTSSNIISDWYHAFHDRRLFMNFIDIMVFRTMQFWGTYHGYRQHGDVSKQLRERFYYPNKLKRQKSDSKKAFENNLIDYSTLYTNRDMT